MKKYKENSVSNFDKQAKVYDHSIFSMYPRKCYEHVINEVNQIAYDRLLDVGCGTGEILNTIATNPEKYYGIDLSKNMLEQAKGKSNAHNITYIAGDSEFLPFEDGYFDLLICTESFHHYPNPQNVLKEFHRVLKRGGKLIICDMYRKAPLRQFYNLLMKLVNTGDVKIYTTKELSHMLSKNMFQLLNDYYPTGQTYLFICKKE